MIHVKKLWSTIFIKERLLILFEEQHCVKQNRHIVFSTRDLMGRSASGNEHFASDLLRCADIRPWLMYTCMGEVYVSIFCTQLQGTNPTFTCLRVQLYMYSVKCIYNLFCKDWKRKLQPHDCIHEVFWSSRNHNIPCGQLHAQLICPGRGGENLTLLYRAL